MKEKVMSQPQSIYLWKVYAHFFNSIDWIFLFLGIIGSIVCSFISPVLMYISSAIYSSGYSKLSNSPPPPAFVQEIINKTKFESVRKSLMISIKRQIVACSTSFVSNFLVGFFWYLIGIRCTYRFKRNYFNLILSQDQGWFDLSNTYELANRVKAQLESFEQGVGIKVGLTLVGISQFVAGFIFSFVTCWKISLVMLTLFPFILAFYFILNVFLKNGIIISRKIWEHAGGIAEELIYNIKTVASFANFEYELKRFYENTEIACRIELMNTFKLGFYQGIIMFLSYSLIFVCFVYGRTLIGIEHSRRFGKDLTGGEVYVCGMCMMISVSSISIIAPNFKGIKESCSAISEYFNLYKRKKQIDLSQSIQKPPKNEIKGKIEFNSVSFSYPSDSYHKLILNEINIIAEPGKKIALVGESGCGKTTAANLIERLYDVSSGKLLIDGIDIKNYDLEYLRNFIGYVQQEPVLFNTSIRDNIIFGREEYLSSIGNIDELIQNACNESYSTDFINNLDDGLDYIVGIKGSKLSGGQRQRIAIARAMITKPKILILDEATSSLDNISKMEVEKAIENISKKNVTIVIITHNLSKVKNVDLIYVLKNGKILEKGTHEQLLSLDGYYSKMIKMRASREKYNQYYNIDKAQEKTIISKKSKDGETEFEFRDNAISLSEKDIPIRPCSIIKELKDYKLVVFLACLGALIFGVMTPILGYGLAKTLKVLNNSIQTIRFDRGLKYSFMYLAFAFLIGIGNGLMVWKFMSVGLHLAKIYRKKLMAKYLSLHLSYFDVSKNSPGSILTKMSINTLELNQMIISILGISIQCSFTFALGLIIGCCYDHRLILIEYCFFPIIIFLNIVRRQFIDSSGKKSIEANIECGGFLSECIMNTKTLFSFNFQRSAMNKYNKIITRIRKKFNHDALIMGLFLALPNTFFFISNICVYVAARHFAGKHSLNTNYMSIILTMININLSQLINTMSDLGNLRKAGEAFRAIYSTLETKSLIPPFRNDNKGKISAMNIRGKIEFKNVTFSYPTRPENKILIDVSFVIMPGQYIGFAGTSGSGKTTIIQLLNRFYDLKEGNGEILIDDINIKDYNLYELRKKIGWVPQEPALFKISPLENIRYGRLDATNGECIEAAKQTKLMHFFEDIEMDKMLNSQIKSKAGTSLEKVDRGDQMSGGEKQRFCIARIFLKNPSLLLLDEVTSALDKESELEIQKSLDKLKLNRTCIIVSQLNNIEKCDQIFVFEK